MKNKRGFTLIELLVVVVILGILSTMGVMSYSNYKKNARDNERVSKATAIVDALEVYYNKNGEYPGCTALTASGPTVINNTLKGLASDILLAPKAPTGVTNSITCADLTTGSTTDFYSFMGDSSASCVAGTACLEWTFKYKDEASNEIVAVKSRHDTIVVNANTPVITGSAISSTAINTSWTSALGAGNYELQRATNSTFTSNLIITTLPETAKAVSGLTQNTTYYFRVRVNTPGPWSNTIIVSTST